MRKFVDIPAEKIRPSEKAVACALGIPANRRPDQRTVNLIETAIDRCCSLAAPAAVLQTIEGDEFTKVYSGEGMNAESTPLDLIAPRADSFALYAVTLGAPVCRKISELFGTNDFADGAALDAAASQAAELAAEEVEKQHAAELSGVSTMAFSPGYCGWHVSAQKALFEVLKPGDVGIELTPTCLMEPLKSVSGVIISGDREIFDFEDDFPFCDACTDRSCRARIAALTNR